MGKHSGEGILWTWGTAASLGPDILSILNSPNLSLSFVTWEYWWWQWQYLTYGLVVKITGINTCEVLSTPPGTLLLNTVVTIVISPTSSEPMSPVTTGDADEGAACSSSDRPLPSTNWVGWPLDWLFVGETGEPERLFLAWIRWSLRLNLSTVWHSRMPRLMYASCCKHSSERLNYSDSGKS